MAGDDPLVIFLTGSRVAEISKPRSRSSEIDEFGDRGGERDAANPVVVVRACSKQQRGHAEQRQESDDRQQDEVGFPR